MYRLYNKSKMGFAIFNICLYIFWMSLADELSFIIKIPKSFGVGHIVNLFTSSGMDLLFNVCQILSAIAIGFLFVIMFDRGKSLWPCILTHSLFNAFSIFTNMQAINGMVEVVVSAVITFISVIYALILIKALPNIQNNSLNIETNEQK